MGDLVQLIGILSVACKFIGHGVVVFCFGLGIRSEVEYRGIVLRVNVPGFVVDEGGIVGSEFGSEGAIGIDVGGIAFLVEE